MFWSEINNLDINHLVLVVGIYNYGIKKDSFNLYLCQLDYVIWIFMIYDSQVYFPVAGGIFYVRLNYVFKTFSLRKIAYQSANQNSDDKQNNSIIHICTCVF